VRRRFWPAVAVVLGAGFAPGAVASTAVAPLSFEARSLDGSGNNLAHPHWGEAGTPYLRRAPSAYADGIGQMVEGPGARYVSNRVFNDIAQNVFSARRLSQWVWTWGQFLDHSFGLRQSGLDPAPVAFDPADPLESFKNDLGAIGFTRSAPAPGTGVAGPRQQVNTVSSYIDAWAVYGGTDKRLEWLRDGPVNGDLGDNTASLFLPGGYLPTAADRGAAAAAPEMELMGRLAGTPDSRVIAGDVRANENVALTAVHTLFAREHNRIVAALPPGLNEQVKFEIARRVVGAEEQYITYTQFLPAVGVPLPPYRGYNPTVDAALSNEFATVGYRMHSMIHGDFDFHAPGYTADQLAGLAREGVTVTTNGSEGTLTVPLYVAFGNPSLLRDVGLGPVLAGLADEVQYANDEQIDNQLRSVLFQVPRPGVTDPAGCSDMPGLSTCFSGVADLGAIDIQRSRDHGIPSYNELRKAFSLPPAATSAAVTGESSEQFPADPQIDRSDPIDDPSILDFVALKDANGTPVQAGTPAAESTVVTARRRTPLAARLKAIYGSVDRLDPFVGMLAEPHVPGSELGQLQLAMWRDQFQRLRDADRFFYANDPALTTIERQYGISYRHTLAELIAVNSGVDPGALAADVFHVPPAQAPSPTG
jgi:hypothetical protein